jgi:hypothetical protein
LTRIEHEIAIGGDGGDGGGIFPYSLKGAKQWIDF